MSDEEEWEDDGPICLHAALDAQHRDDLREAAEKVMDDGVIRTMDERVELVVAEADAIANRREIKPVQTCPHCGGVLES